MGSAPPRDAWQGLELFWLPGGPTGAFVEPIDWPERPRAVPRKQRRWVRRREQLEARRRRRKASR